MSIQLVTGFLVNSAEKLDNRIVASGSAARNAIPYKYEGLRVFDTFNNRAYYWDGASFNPEITDQVNGTTNYVPKFTSQYYIGNSNIYIDSYKVGVNTNTPLGDYTYLQLGGTNISEDPNYFSGQSLPIVIHKGYNTTIGSNWYSSGGEQYFQLSKGSTMLDFDTNTGDFSIKIRGAGNTFANKRQGIYVSNLGRVGIGWTPTLNFGVSNPPTESLEVAGNVKLSGNLSALSGTVSSSFVYLANSSTGQSRGITLLDTTPGVGTPIPVPPAGQGLFIDWGSSFGNNYFAGIAGYSQGFFGGDLQFFTTNDISGIAGSNTTRSVRMTIKNTGFVGIGTTSPTTLLQVAGTASSNVVAIGDGSSSNPSLVFSSNTNTGIYKYGTDTIGFLAGGVNNVRMDPSGLISDVIFNNQIIQGTTNNKVITGVFTTSISFFSTVSFVPTIGQISVPGNSFIWVEATFLSKLYTGTMTPTLLSTVSTLREYYRTDSTGQLFLIGGDDPLAVVTSPWSVGGSPSSSYGTISMSSNPGYGLINTTVPGSLVFKQSGGASAGFTLSVQVHYKVHINFS